MDKLTLEIKTPLELDSSILPSISVSGKGIQVGRKAGNDWVLPDPTRYISGAHFEIICEAGRYLLRDVSTNGTFLNGTRQSLENPHSINNHDQIKIGHYVIEARLTPVVIPAVAVALEPTDMPVPPPESILPELRSKHGSSSDSPAQIVPELIPEFDLMAPFSPEPDHEPELKPDPLLAPEINPEPKRLPLDPARIVDTPLKPFSDSKDTLDEGRVEEEPTPDLVAEVPIPAQVLAPPMSRNVQSPPVGAPMTSASSNQTGRPDTQAPKANSHTQIPDFFSLMANKTGMIGVSGPPTGGLSEIPPAPSVSRPPSKISSPPVFMSKHESTLEAPTPKPESVPKPSVVTDINEIITTQSQGLGERFSDPSLTPKSASILGPATVVSAPTAPVLPTPATIPPISPAAAQPAPKSEERPQNAELTPNGNPDLFLRGFLDGAGIDDANLLEIPIEDLGYMLGQCARIGTQEMMEMLQDRAAVKFLVSKEDRTMQVTTGNNPMKFMPDAEQAFETMFVKPRSGYLGGDAGFKNALSDIRLHQAALMAAVQPALADMLDGLAPEEIEEDTGKSRLGGAARKYWDEYSKRWNSRSAQGESGMLDAFLRALACRYAEALDKHT